MSDTKNIDYIAAMVSQIDKSIKASQDKRLDTVTSLLGAIETSLAEIVQMVERGSGAQELKDLAEAIRAIKHEPPSVDVAAPVVNVSPTPIEVNVPQQAAPTVNVNVEPTPISVEAVMPPMPAPVIHLIEKEQKGGTWEMRLPGRYGEADRVLTIKRTA